MRGAVENGGAKRLAERWLPSIFLILALSVAGVIRFAMVDRILPHLDESATLLAIEQTAVLVGMPPLYLAQVSDYRFAVEPGGSTDYEDSISCLTGNVGAGDRVILALPQLLVFANDGGRLVEHSHFLAGPEDRERTSRYVKTQSNGDVTDFWLGIPAIKSTAAICRQLEVDGGNVWLVVDRFRLNDDSFFGGDMASRIHGATDMAFSGPNFGRVWQVLPRGEWTAEAVALCPVAPADGRNGSR